MRFFKKLFMFCYMILMLATGIGLFLIALNLFPVEQWTEALINVQESLYYQIAIGIAGGVVILTGLIIPYRMAKKMKRSRLITFQNPDGEVTVSISAIEDYIHKITEEIHEITNVRSKVSFSRKGINIVSSVTIKAGANIPEITERIQMQVKNKVQSMLGGEEKINMTLYINKILGIPAEEAPLPEEGSPAQVPFR